jgi:hypothetical protein
LIVSLRVVVKSPDTDEVFGFFAAAGNRQENNKRRISSRENTGIRTKESKVQLLFSFSHKMSQSLVFSSLFKEQICKTKQCEAMICFFGYVVRKRKSWRREITIPQQDA